MQIIAAIFLLLASTAYGFNCLPFKNSDTIVASYSGYTKHFSNQENITNESNSDLKGAEYCIKSGLDNSESYCITTTNLTDSYNFNNTITSTSYLQNWECKNNLTLAVGGFIGLASRYNKPLIFGLDFRVNFYGVGIKTVCVPKSENYPGSCTIAPTIEYSF